MSYQEKKIKDRSLYYVENPEIYSISKRPYKEAIFNEGTNARFVNVQDIFWHNIVNQLIIKILRSKKILSEKIVEIYSLS